MRRSNWTASIVLNENDPTVYLGADDFGEPGGGYRRQGALSGVH
jgi:hypothetical protein